MSTFRFQLVVSPEAGVPVATACRLDGQKRHDRSDPRPWRGMIRVSAQPGQITYVHGLSARGHDGTWHAIASEYRITRKLNVQLR